MGAEFAVLTQCLVKADPAASVITTSTYMYSLQRIEEVDTWAASIAGQVRKQVEPTVFITPASADVTYLYSAANGLMSMSSAIVFFGTDREAAELLRLRGSAASAHARTVDVPVCFSCYVCRWADAAFPQ